MRRDAGKVCAQYSIGGMNVRCSVCGFAGAKMATGQLNENIINNMIFFCVEL